MLRAVGVARFCPSLAAFGARPRRAGAGAGAGLAAVGARGAEAVAQASTTASTSPTFTSARLPGGADLDQHAGLLGADLEIDLLGFELDDGLAGGDRLALALQPARDARFDDRFTELGDDDVGGHGILCSLTWVRG